MVDSDAGPEGQSRPPTLEDLLHLCRELNHTGANYIVIGGMAMIHLGFTRATEDIDLLIDPSPENQAKIRKALMTLPDQAVREMSERDLEDYQVVRVADEIVVDLMKSACGIAYPEASGDIAWAAVFGGSDPVCQRRIVMEAETGTGRERRDRPIVPARVARDQG